MKVTALVRSSGAAPPGELRGANTRKLDLSDPETVQRVIGEVAPDTVISCLASRSGAPGDALAVDRDANLNLIDAAKGAGTEHFILLSAICVQKPRLAFQHAKLAAENALRSSGIDYTIIRPTAFFKSLSGQVKRVAAGKPFLIFGNGELTRCKPISDGDLARFIVDCATEPTRRGKVLPIGGPGPAVSLKEQGHILFELTGHEAKFRSISPVLFDLAAKVFSLGAPFSDWFAAKAEYARIAKYYATESMLVLDSATGHYDADATPEYGTEILREHYAQLLADELLQQHSPAST